MAQRRFGAKSMTTDATEMSARLGRAFDELASHGRTAVAHLSPDEMCRLAAFGLDVANGWAQVGDDVELLRTEAVRSALTPQAAAWLARLEIRAHLPSTNTALFDRAPGASVEGQVLTAEVQTAGRGRRGRNWHSPFARNLAVSLGVALPWPAAEVGAFSLVVGLAVRTALADIGLRDVQLKWPNDVLLEGRKLAGILIEVRDTSPAEAVVGIGINVGGGARVAQRVDQPVADITERIRRPPRNRLLGAVINRLVEAKRRFATAGFAPFVAEWEHAHHHQDRTVTLLLPGRTAPVTGTALGVDRGGALRLATAQGERTFVAGEVSLRDASPIRRG